jgi:DNA-binding response OmpR family regulator
VLFVSGYDPDPAQGAALDGGREFLSKPFTPSALLARVRAMLDGA